MDEKKAPVSRGEDGRVPTRRNKNSLLIYVSVLFAAAFLLVLFSFLLSQRSSSQTISTLSQTSATAVGRVQELEAAYAQLNEENLRLNAEIESLTEDLSDLQSAYDAMSRQSSDTEDALAAARTQSSEQQAELEDLQMQLAEAQARLDDLTAAAQVQTLLMQGAQAALSSDTDGLSTVLAQIDVSRLDSNQQTLYMLLNQKLTWAAGSEHAQ